MDIKIKICGLRKEKEFELASSLNLDFVGIVFYKCSPRFIPPKNLPELLNGIDKKLKIIAVVVNPSNADIDKILENVTLYGIQMHGNETVERIIDVKKRTNLSIIKAIPINNNNDILYAKKFEDAADMLLFDSKPNKESNLPGGNAKLFDWNLLNGEKWKKPWFLSGGLDINNINNAIKDTNAKYFDVSSGVEIKKGEKDLDLMRIFTDKIRKFENVKH
ncbi:MAG: phosphoribosylanthranilate isomerase [Rhodospirillaceae bacterium]|mgnify:CR=1 FL=1|nr:phosphoribosylanthranilate isomerase [Rhodospirillaceae bacterium]|tara:strand:+ start:751 stop:1407 length:657 start_codon:yes stop_codon:yes gene_type:complete